LRRWIEFGLKAAWGAFLALTSLYCLLAFLPYTYYALIKAPAYSWVPVFVHHHALWFWLASLGAAFAFWRKNRRDGTSVADVPYLLAFGIVACTGVFLALRPFLVGVQSDQTAYWASIVALWLIVLVVVVCDLARDSGAARGEEEANARPNRVGHFSYAAGVVLALGIAVVSNAGADIRGYADLRTWNWHAADLLALFWSMVSHVVVAIVLISVVNLIATASAKTKRPRTVKSALFGVLIFAALWVLFLRFLENALSFDGWRAQLYAASLSAGLTLLGFSIARPFLLARRDDAEVVSRGEKFFLVGVAAAFAAGALAVPTLLGGGDWNRLYEGAFTLLLWAVLSFCVFRLWRQPDIYPLKTIAAVLVLSLVSYKALEMTQLLWAKPLGKTEDEIQRGIENYTVRDVSFHLAYRLLGNGRSENCGDLCRILREYTEVRDARTTTDLRLVDSLVTTQSERPNIFIFVIDSVRPDYLGAYNFKATFTPNLDAFARDSVVLKNVFTPYAGTSLSEPAIWAGALLLHAHFLQPFERVNSLEKLANTDGYQMAVSYDEILREILSPSDDLIKLDADKKLWNQVEVCSTILQAEKAFDQRADKTRPIFFYTQPKNVHQFAHNDLPTAKDANWPAQQGFNYRISFELHQVDECIGGFFGWLKTRGMYDDSIVIVTADHGDATGELGRNSHSVVIYPEVMRVPLIVHLPKRMRETVVYDDSQVSALIDIAPSLYYLLGHKPIVANPLFGHPLFTETGEELHRYRREDLLFASDVRAAYGLLSDNGRYFYATYDSPAQSYLYDLSIDPIGVHDILTSEAKKQYDERIIEYLHAIADFYGYKPGIGSLLTSSR
jgi:hypothetical protein